MLDKLEMMRDLQENQTLYYYVQKSSIKPEHYTRNIGVEPSRNSYIRKLNLEAQN